MIEITIKTDNAAFEESPEREIARILRRLAKDIQHHQLLDDAEYHPLAIHDLNGNDTGTVWIQNEEE